MRETKCVVVWNYEQSFCPFFKLEIFKSSSLSLLSSLSNSYKHVTFFTTTTKCLHLIFRYIYTTTTYIFAYHLSAEFTIRATHSSFYAHTNRRKDGHDDQQQQRGDDDDDEKKSSS